jgi:hypothetical protein
MSLAHTQSAVVLLRGLQQQTIATEQLTARHRRVCVRYLLDERPHLTLEQMAQLLGTTRQSIAKIKKQIFTQDKWLVQPMDVDLYVSELLMQYNSWIKKVEQCAARADTAGEQSVGWSKASALKRQLTEQLMDLGALKRAPVEIVGHHTFKEIVQLAAGHKDEIQRILSGDGRGMGSVN